MSVASASAFQPDEPELIEVTRRAAESAAAHVRAGYAVLPVRPDGKAVFKARRRGPKPVGITSLTDVARTWNGSHVLNIGIDLTGSGLVVPDVDGPDGELSLAALFAGASPPPTYEVCTEHGRHLYYRIPPGEPTDLKSQYGGQHGRPQLDIKMTWLLIAPGSTKPNGFVYRGNQPHVPRIDGIPFLPMVAWQNIKGRGSSRDRVEVSARRRPEGLPTDGRTQRVAVPPLDVSGPRHTRLRALLNDTSDGRDVRVLQAVSAMIRLGASDEQIYSTLLGHPLGEKVWEQRSSAMQYVNRKIEAARRAVEQPDGDWDRQEFLLAVATRQMPGRSVRVLTHLAQIANGRGMVQRGQRRIALGSAAEGVSDVLSTLRDQGWLYILHEGDVATRTPATYRLMVPAEMQILTTESRAPSPHTPTPPIFPTKNLSMLAAHTDHDAFRSAHRSVGSSFGTLLLLAMVGPLGKAELAAHLGKEAAGRRLNRLREARLVTVEDDFVNLTDEDLLPLLDQIAADAGTAGKGETAMEKYIEDCLRDWQYREDMGLVGTEAWRDAQERDALRDLFTNRRDLLAKYESIGVSAVEVSRGMVDAHERHLRDCHTVAVAAFSAVKAPTMRQTA